MTAPVAAQCAQSSGTQTKQHSKRQSKQAGRAGQQTTPPQPQPGQQGISQPSRGGRTQKPIRGSRPVQKQPIDKEMLGCSPSIVRTGPSNPMQVWRQHLGPLRGTSAGLARSSCLPSPKLPSSPKFPRPASSTVAPFSGCYRFPLLSATVSPRSTFLLAEHESPLWAELIQAPPIEALRQARRSLPFTAHRPRHHGPAKAPGPQASRKTSALLDRIATVALPSIAS
ncbi:hypothetical protein G7046_g7496 [Stylonectria norvegica]|nr:hypothetical protein G7046_g7496 [Stylonectria norvegica]